MENLSSQIAALEAMVEELREFQNQVLRLFTDKGKNPPTPAKVLERLGALRIGYFGFAKEEKPGLEMAAAYFDDLAKGYEAEAARMSSGATQKGYAKNAETLRAYEKDLLRMATGKAPVLCSSAFLTAKGLRMKYAVDAGAEVSEALKTSENAFSDSAEEIAEIMKKHREAVKEARKERKARAEAEQDKKIQKLVEALKASGRQYAAEALGASPTERAIAYATYGEKLASALASRLMEDLINQKAPGVRVFYVRPKTKEEASPKEEGSEDLLSAAEAIAEALKSTFGSENLIHKDAQSLVEHFKAMKGE